MYDKYEQLAALVGSGKRVLDVGCADGHLSARLKRAGNEVLGIELLPERAARARLEGVDVVVADICAESCWQQLPGTFDVVIFADVLEHVMTPRVALEHVRPILRPGGYVLVSLPNIAHFRIRLRLLAGQFEYKEEGIMDRTHVRFYTRETARRFVTSCGYAIDDERWPNDSAGPVRHRVASVLLRRFPGVFAPGFLFRAHPV